MRVLVTGDRGYIGAVLVPFLGAVGHEVVGLDSFLTTAESGIHIAGWKIDLQDGTHLVVLGVAMALVLVLYPAGITGSREARIPRRWRR